MKKYLFANRQIDRYLNKRIFFQCNAKIECETVIDNNVELDKN